MLKSFKRKERRERSAHIFEKRISNIKLTWNNDRKLPIKSASVFYRFENESNRTDDIHRLKTEAKWLKYLKNTPCNYKSHTKPYYIKNQEHQEREEKKRAMNEEMANYYDEKRDEK